jgi:hypothetical protein
MGSEKVTFFGWGSEMVYFCQCATAVEVWFSQLVCGDIFGGEEAQQSQSLFFILRDQITAGPGLQASVIHLTKTGVLNSLP